MSKHDLQNERLDRIGRKLLEAVRAGDDEIEKIVGAPHLFDSIKARIKAEERRQNSDNSRRLRGVFVVWNRREAAAALASLIIVFGLIAEIVFTKQDSPPDLAAQSNVPEIQKGVDSAEISPPQLLAKDSAEIEKTKSPVKRNPAIAERAVFKKATAKLQKTERKTERKTDLAERLRGNEPSGEFYAVTYAGNPGEAGEDLQIIRADLSPSSLFALGVNLPVENENAKIRTDMLVGSDGIVRGIRFVR